MIEIGKIYKTNNCGYLKVLERIEKKFYKCEFLEYSYIKIFEESAIIKGTCYNPFYPTTCKRGFRGTEEKIDYKIFNLWSSILHRCYNEKLNHYKWYGGIGIEVSQEWLNYSNFEKWYKYQKSLYKDENLELNIDKDIYVNVNHLDFKLNYTKDNCFLIPYDLNNYIYGDNWTTGIRRDFSILNNKNKIYESRIQFNGKRINKCFNSFQEAKNWYSEEKKKIWITLINNYQIPNNIKEILLQYDFSWKWIWENWTEEEILYKIESKQNFK